MAANSCQLRAAVPFSFVFVAFFIGNLAAAGGMTDPFLLSAHCPGCAAAEDRLLTGAGHDSECAASCCRLCLGLKSSRGHKECLEMNYRPRTNWCVLRHDSRYVVAWQHCVH